MQGRVLSGVPGDENVPRMQDNSQREKGKHVRSVLPLESSPGSHRQVASYAGAQKSK